MTTVSASQVQAAIEALETSYTYDHRDRWMSAYQTLRTLYFEMDQWLRPYAWIIRACLALALVCLVLLILGAFLRPIGSATPFDNFVLDVVLMATLWSLPAWLIILGPWLSHKVAARRFPLLAFRARIAEATRRFHALADEPEMEEV